MPESTPNDDPESTSTDASELEEAITRSSTETFEAIRDASRDLPPEVRGLFYILLIDQLADEVSRLADIVAAELDTVNQPQ